MVTHHPLAIAELEKEQVQVMRRDVTRQVRAAMPDRSPRGMGYAGILTSDIFGLQTTLDQTTEDLIRDRQNLTEKPELDEENRTKLARIDKELQSLGFSTAHWDGDYQLYLQRRRAVAAELFDAPVDPAIEARRQVVADELIKAILTEEESSVDEASS